MSMNWDKAEGAVKAGTIVAAICVLVTGSCSLRRADNEARKEIIRRTYVCLEADLEIPGRCLLAVHRLQTCWRFEMAPNQMQPTAEYSPGNCIKKQDEAGQPR